MTPEGMADRAGEVSALLKTLAHPARLMIVCTLVEGERSVGALEAEIDVHQPTLSQQLTVLRGAGIVRTRRASKQIFYRLTEDKVTQLISALYAIYCVDAEAPAKGERKKAETAS
jgi:DNA-binding transcriptional ArsR family regulator